MHINANQQIHSSILQSLAALKEYDKVKYWDEDMQEEVKALLLKLEKCIEKERVYYTMYRKIKLTGDQNCLEVKNSGNKSLSERGEFYWTEKAVKLLHMLLS